MTSPSLIGLRVVVLGLAAAGGWACFSRREAGGGGQGGERARLPVATEPAGKPTHPLCREAESYLPWRLVQPAHVKMASARIRTLRDGLRGLYADNAGFNAGLGRGLLEFVSDPTTGFGLSPRSPYCPRELSADEAIDEKCADCTELSSAYFGCAQLARLDPVFIEFTADETGRPFLRPHFGVGLRIDSKDRNRIIPVDLTLGLAGFDVQGRSWVVVADDLFRAHHHIIRSELVPSDLPVGERDRLRRCELERAHRLAPSDPRVPYSLGNYYFDRREWRAAIRQYQDALALDPRHGDARENLRQARVRLRGLFN